MLDDARLQLRRRKVQIHGDKALTGAGFEILEHALVTGVVRNHQLESGRGLQYLSGLVDRQDPSMVGQGVQHHHGVLSGLDHFIQIADAPSRTARVSGPSCHTVPSCWMRKRPMRSLAARSSWQGTVISGRPSFQAMCSTKRVLPQPVGPLSMTARPRAWHCSNSATSLPVGWYQGPATASAARPCTGSVMPISHHAADGNVIVSDARFGDIQPRPVTEEVVDEQSDAGGEQAGADDQHDEVDLDLQLGIEIAHAHDPFEIELDLN